MVGGDDPLYLKFWTKLTPFEQKRRFSIDIRFYSTSAKHLVKKVQLTLIGSPLRASQ